MADTLMYFKKLEAAGFTRKQAETTVEIMSDYISGNFATREDIKDVRGDMKAEFADLRADMNAEFADVRADMKAEFAAVRSEMASGFADVKAEFAAVRAEVRADMLSLENRLTLRLGGMLFVAVGALAALIKLG